MFEIIEDPKNIVKIKLVGIGGAGCNTINFAIEDGIKGVETIAVNTDLQILSKNLSPNKFQIGEKLTNGHGAGGDPEIGRKAAEDAREEIRELLKDADMVFLTCGEGGGTGTGATPIFAEEAKNLNALVVAVVSKPWSSEGKRRMDNALMGIEELRMRVDTLIVISNDRLLSIVPKNMPANESLRFGNETLFNAIKGIVEIITIPGIINVDFADVRTVMSEKGAAVIGMGIAENENRAVEAATRAISSPLLDDLSIKGARGLLINIGGGEDLSMTEINEATNLIYTATESEPYLIPGFFQDPSINGKVKVTVIATGLKDKTIPTSSEIPDLGAFQSTKSDIERPTFIRLDKNRERTTKKIEIDENNLEIPTFLRKQID
ncbi:MAG: cell division protein FtsZ [candidate division WOR-3 bacterium]